MRRPFKAHPWLYVALVAGVAAASLLPDRPVRGAEWDFTPRLGITERYTDNVRLAPSGQEEHDFITTLAPGFHLSGIGRRATVDLDYTLRQHFYARNSNRNTAFHRLRGDSTVELARNRLFLDAGVSRREQAINFLEPVGVDTGVRGRNVAEVSTARVSPYLLNRFGSFANSQVRYTHSRIWRHRGGIGRQGDSFANRADVDVNSGPMFTTVFWNLNYSYEDITFQEAVDVTFERASGTLGAHVTPRLRVFGTAGEEWNEFASDRDAIDGSFWNVGVGWNPTRRTEMEATYGERFFGNTWSANIRHRMRRTTFAASYVETVAVQRRFQLEGDEFLFPFDEGLILRPECQVPDPPEDCFIFIGELSLTEAVFLSERANASVTFRTGRTTFVLGTFYRKREFEDAQPGVVGLSDDERIGGRFGVSWRAAPRTRLNYSARWSRNVFHDFVEVNGAREDRINELMSSAVSVSRDFQPNLVGSVGYRHQRRRAIENEPLPYGENSVFASVFMTF